MTSTPTIRPAAMLPPVQLAQAVTLTRLVRVELRKLVDTRAGLWLLAFSIIGSLGAAGLWLTLAMDEAKVPWFGPLGLVIAPFSLLLPVVAILAFTQEWSQRTSLTTFTLEPRRGRVMGAKLIAVGLVTLACALIAIAFSAGAALIVTASGAGTIVWAWQAGPLLSAVVALPIGVAMGAGFGMLLMNSPAAIVAYFLVPMFTVTLSMLPGLLGTIGSWINGGAWSLLFTPMTATQWGQAATAFVLWVALPLTLGWWRTTRVEAK